MTNWNCKEIHKDFSKRNWRKWKEYGLTYQEIKQWILVGFEPKDHNRVNQWRNNFTFQEVKAWIDVGLDRQNTEFALYLQWEGYQPNQVLNSLEGLKEEFDYWLKKSKPAHEYLNTVYPKEKRNTVKCIEVSCKDLTENLDLNDFLNLEKLDCSFNQLTVLNLSDCLKLKRIKCNNNQLAELKVNNLTSLVGLECSGNQLTNLDVNNCSQLKELRCSNNYLKILKLPSQIEYLSINSNSFPKQNLSMFSHLVDLKELHLGNWSEEKNKQGNYSHFYGSLEHLQNLNKLESLDISNTDISSGVEYLPATLKVCWLTKKQWKVFYSISERPESKLKEISEQLTNFLEYGLCEQCQKVISEYNWCQYCNENANQNIDNRNENANQNIIDNLIQKFEGLELIAYEKFTNIEYLAEGGFGKVYKAKWNEKNKLVALKSLNNSQHISEVFLREIANHQALSNCIKIVKCYGVSQDPQTNKCLIIMDYIRGGDLKRFLQNNYLSFEEKFLNLSYIAWGLNEIHGRKLIHRDFHVGNILNDKKEYIYCRITDLGLCRPVDEKNNEKVYGVLPYVAPEVLREKGYSQKSDIYSLGIIAWEIFSGKSPYYDLTHDDFLAVKICQGLRPRIEELKTPQLLKDLISQCWDADPEKRPETKELLKIIGNWKNEVKKEENTEFTQQYQEAVKIDKKKFYQILSKIYKEYKGEIKEVKLEKIEELKKELFEEFFKKNDYRKYNEKIKRRKKAKKEFDRFLARENNNLLCGIHPRVIYTSRHLNFKNLPQPQNSQELNRIFYKITEELEDLRISDSVEFNKELQTRFKNLEFNEIFIAKSEEFAPIKTQEQPVISTNWTNINPSFTDELVQEWQNHNFTYEQCCDYLSIGLQPTDSSFAFWLQQELRLTPEQLLNENTVNLVDLKEQFQAYQEQLTAQIEILSKK